MLFVVATVALAAAGGRRAVPSGGHAGVGRAAVRVSGGSRAQRRVLRAVLAALRPTRLRRVAILPASGGVELRAPVGAVLATWELLVAGETFYFRSGDLQLPPVVSVAARQA